MTKFQRHQVNWKSCTACSLCEGRRNVVLFRGQIPCDVLFIGEAPGASEDVIGSPFTGPAGHLLDDIVSKAMDKAGHEHDTGAQRPDGGWYSEWRPADLRVGYTNLISCIPLDESGSKVKEPPEESIKACEDRLEEILLICKPKLVVCVGKLPEKWLPKLFGSAQHVNDNMVTITHPAAILRMEGFQQGLATQQVVVTLRDAFAGLE